MSHHKLNQWQVFCTFVVIGLLFGTVCGLIGHARKTRKENKLRKLYAYWKHSIQIMEHPDERLLHFDFGDWEYLIHTPNKKRSFANIAEEAIKAWYENHCPIIKWK